MNLIDEKLKLQFGTWLFYNLQRRNTLPPNANLIL